MFWVVLATVILKKKSPLYESPTMGLALRSWKDETRGGNITGDLHCSMILEHFLVFLVISKQRCLHYLQTKYEKTIF